MATMTSRDNRTRIAGADLTNEQFKFVKLGAEGKVVVADTAGEEVFGVLIVPAAQDRAVTVTLSGHVMIKAGGALAAGDPVATDATGTAVTAVTGDIVLGYATETAVSGQVTSIELVQGGNAAA